MNNVPLQWSCEPFPLSRLSISKILVDGNYQEIFLPSVFCRDVFNYLVRHHPSIRITIYDTNHLGDLCSGECRSCALFPAYSILDIDVLTQITMSNTTSPHLILDLCQLNLSALEHLARRHNLSFPNIALKHIIISPRKLLGFPFGSLVLSELASNQVQPPSRLITSFLFSCSTPAFLPLALLFFIIQYLKDLKAVLLSKKYLSLLALTVKWFHSIPLVAKLLFPMHKRNYKPFMNHQVNDQLFSRLTYYSPAHLVLTILLCRMSNIALSWFSLLMQSINHVDFEDARLSIPSFPYYVADDLNSSFQYTENWGNIYSFKTNHYQEKDSYLKRARISPGNLI